MLIEINRHSRISSLSMLCLINAAIFALIAQQPVMAAGEVMASVENGILTITGDDFANRIEVNEYGPSYVEVTGLDTKIIGSGQYWYQISDTSIIFEIAYAEVHSIFIGLMGGDDDVSFHSARDLELIGWLTVDMGDGRDSVSAANLNAAGANIYSSGHLSVDLHSSDFSDFLGTNANEQGLDDISVGLGKRDSRGAYLTGAVNVSVSRLRTSHLYVKTDPTNDFGTNNVTVNGLYVANDAEFVGDDGDDVMIIYNAQIDGDANIVTDNLRNPDTAGADKADIRNVSINGDLIVQSGDGRFGDLLEVRDSSMSRLSFQAGNGPNDFLVKDSVVSTELTFFGGSAQDVVNIDHVGLSSGDLRVYTGNDNDIVDIKSVQASGSMIVRLGAGNDRLAISNQSSAWLAELDGGSNSGGRDTLLFSGRFDRTDITGFENSDAPIMEAGSQVVAGRPRW